MMVICFEIEMPDLPAKIEHVHDRCDEFFLSLAGRGSQHVEGRAIPMRKGDLFFFPAGQSHIGNGPCRGAVLSLERRRLGVEAEADLDARRLLESLERRALEGENRIPLTRPGARTARACLTEMATAWDRDRPENRMLMKGLALAFLAALARDEEAGPLVAGALTGPRAAERVAPAIRHLQGHFMEPVTVAEMAARTHLSRSHFHAVFKAEMGCTFKQYLNRLRVAAAERLLRETDRTVLAIALDCGFNGLGHFYHVFKGATGTTPKAFRETT